MWFEIFNIIFLLTAISWIKSLAVCGCAKGLKRDFMQFYFSAGIVFQFAVLLGMSHMLNWPMTGLAIAYGFVAFSFIKEMDSKLCECSGRARSRWFFWLTLGQTAWAIAQILTK